MTANFYFQDARRPFANVNQHLGGGQVRYHHPGYHQEWLDPEYLDPTFDLAAEGNEDRETVLERLKRQQESKQDGFTEKIKYWESARTKQQDAYDDQLKVSQFDRISRCSRQSWFNFRAPRARSAGRTTSESRMR